MITNMKRFASAILVFAMIFSIIPSVYAEKDDTVTLIVEVEGDPLLARRNADEYTISEFEETEIASNSKNEIYSTQAEVFSDIKEIDSSAQKGFVYTYLVNGFSITVNENDIDKIKALPNVKNVYVSNTFEIDESDEIEMSGEEIKATSDACCKMIGSDYAHEQNLSGEGRVIAIIDSAFDVNHEFFTDSVSNPRYSKDDISNIISKNNFNVDVTANRVYRSSKIPFAYNYSKNNTDTYQSKSASTHGQHVAGIAAGKNGHLPDGTLFNSVAPEAQIVLMSILDGGRAINYDAIIKALDDAAKLDVDAINLSLGSDCQLYDPLYEKTITAAQKAGILVAAASGNAARGTNHDVYDTPVWLTDYSTSGTPAQVHSATSVASVQAGGYWQIENTIKLNGEKQVKYENQSMTTQFDGLYGQNLEYVFLSDYSNIAYDSLNNKVFVVIAQETMPDWDKVMAQSIKGIVIAASVDTKENQKDSYINMALQFGKPAAYVPDTSLAEYLKSKQSGNITVTDTGTLQQSTVEMARLTSWGVSENLELKPDITTPGEKIYSSLFDNQYGLLSGTSMATPHFTGLTALTRQYIDKTYPEYKGNKAQLAENMLMSSAEILNASNNIPYSPRRQGAGVANMKNMMNSSVILLGDNGEKSKISLKEIGDSFTLKLTAKNLANSDVTFDKATLTLITDDYKENEGKNCFADSRSLKADVTLPQNITVPANGTKDIEFTVTLNKEELDENSKIFTNGFFVEGYVSLVKDDKSVTQVNIPFMGYYGGWKNERIFDYYMFREGRFTDQTCLISSKSSGPNAILGENPIRSDERNSKYDSAEFGGYSPNGDGNMDNLNIGVMCLRTVTDSKAQIIDSNGKVVADDLKLSNKDYTHNGGYLEKFVTNSVEYTEKLPDGDYTAKVVGRLAYEGSEQESVEMPFYVDTVRPRFTKYTVREEGGKKYIDFEATDNRYVAGFQIRLKGKEEFDAQNFPVPAAKNAAYTADVTGLDIESVLVYDYAGNATEYTQFPFSAQVLDYKAYDSAASVAAKITNITDKNITADIVAAAYDKNGKLVSVSVKKQARIKPEANNVILSLENINNGVEKVKLMVVDSMETFSPQMPAVVYDTNKTEKEE